MLESLSNAFHFMMMATVSPSESQALLHWVLLQKTFKHIHNLISFLVLFVLLSMFLSLKLHSYLGTLLGWSLAVAEYGCPTMTLIFPTFTCLTVSFSRLNKNNVLCDASLWHYSSCSNMDLLY